MRAVRQDLTVQGLALVPGAADVLRTAANFYVVAGYLMCDEVSPPPSFEMFVGSGICWENLLRATCAVAFEQG